jgi:hypothetical protein
VLSMSDKKHVNYTNLHAQSIPLARKSDDDPTTRIRRLSSPSSKNEYAGNRTQTICAGPAASCGIGNEC